MEETRGSNESGGIKEWLEGCETFRTRTVKGREQRGREKWLLVEQGPYFTEDFFWFDGGNFLRYDDVDPRVHSSRRQTYAPERHGIEISRYLILSLQTTLGYLGCKARLWK